MTETKGRVLVVTIGKELIDEMTPSMSGRGLELVCVPSLKYAADRLGAGDCFAIVVDFHRIAAAEREAFLALHKQFPKVHFFTLESIVSKECSESYPFKFEQGIISFDETIREIVDDVLVGIDPSIISAKFHNTIILTIFGFATDCRLKIGINKVVLSGGVFQNK